MKRAVLPTTPHGRAVMNRGAVLANSARQKLHGKGKYVAGGLAIGLAVNGLRGRTGRGSPAARGRQTGMYMY